MVKLGVQPTLANPSSLHSYQDDILGVAIFDTNGLPREYFTTSDCGSMNWVQTVFQSLGLKSLLMSSLRVEGFHQATIRTVKHCAIVIKQKNHYMALLMQPSDVQTCLVHQPEFYAWLENFEISRLLDDPRFSVV